MEIQSGIQFQDNQIYAHAQPIPDPDAMAEAGTLPSIVSSELDSITIAYGTNNGNAYFATDAYNHYPSEDLQNIHTTSSSASPSSSSSSSSDIGYPSSLQPSSPSDCGSEFTELGYCLNNNNNNNNAGCINTASFDDSGNESIEAEENDVNDPDYVPLAKKTTLGRCSKKPYVSQISAFFKSLDKNFALPYFP